MSQNRVIHITETTHMSKSHYGDIGSLPLVTKTATLAAKELIRLLFIAVGKSLTESVFEIQPFVY